MQNKVSPLLYETNKWTQTCTHIKQHIRRRQSKSKWTQEGCLPGTYCSFPCLRLSDLQQLPILDNKQRCVSSCREMNELCDAAKLWIEVPNAWIEIKNIFSTKQLCEQIKGKRGVGRKMRQRTKSGLCDTFTKLMVCQQDTDEYFCGIKMATQV